MAQVPYSPVPDVVPQVPGPARVGIDTPPAAFGAATAAATRQLGQQTEQSSNEMFQTYLYSKQLENDTWAKNDFVNQSAKIGEIENALYGLKSQEAVNAAPKAAEQIRQIYQNAIANAPNPQAGRMLGDQLSRRVGFSLVDIGRHSGQERLKAAGDASASTVAVGFDLISKSPLNEDLFQSYVKDGGIIDQEAANLERLGFGKAAANAIKLKNQAWEARFESLYAKPDQAQALYNQHEKEIPPAAQENIIRLIKSAESTAKFNASYSAAADKAQIEKDLDEISARNRIVTPDGQAGYKPEAIAEVTRYIQQNPGADKQGHERLGWMRQANEDAAKGIVIQTDWDAVAALTAPDKMFSKTNPTNERDIAVLENARKIGPKDRDWVLNTIKLRDSGDKEALANPLFKVANESAKALVEGTTAKDRMMNAGNYAAFQYQFLTAYLKKVSEGKLEPDDLDMGNEKGLLRKSMESWVPGIGQTIRSNGGVGAPQEAPPAAPSAPAPLSTAPPLPPRADLKVGESYRTPNNGVMTWTGTGFLTPEDWARKQKPKPKAPEANM